MANGKHKYVVSVQWTGNRGSGTSSDREYGREHTISSSLKPDIPACSDPEFFGDPKRWNPKELFIASITACHKLWYLHLCSTAGIAVLFYSDEAKGIIVAE